LRLGVVFGVDEVAMRPTFLPGGKCGER
jgi:hypothetical protein